MRFDLELNITDVLTKDGLENVAETLYSTDMNIEPMQWDTKSISLYGNTGNINVSSFNNLELVPEKFFMSGLTEDSTIEIKDIVNNEEQKFLVLNGGDFYSARSKTSLSSLKLVFKIDYINSYYSHKLDNDYDIDSIDIFTLSINSDGLIIKEKIFKYVEYSDSLSSTFSSSKDEFCYTIYENTVYLNIDKILYQNTLIGRILDGSRIFTLPEFPAKDISLLNLIESDYVINNGIIKIKNETSIELRNQQDIVVSYTVLPIITYKNKTKEQRENINYFRNSIDSRSLDFSNGSICVYSKLLSTQIPYKVNIISSSTEARVSDNIKIEGIITDIDGVPLPDKNMTLEVTSENIKWQNTNSNKYTAITGLSGSISSNIRGDASSIGSYIQKEWISNVEIDGQLRGKVVLPYRLDVAANDNFIKKDALNSIYTYYIQSDDPLAGKAFANGDEVGIDEYYKSNNIRDYILKGRKIAVIGLVNGNTGIQSIYKKPIDIQLTSNISIEYRDLFVKEQETYIMSSVLGGTLTQTYSQAILNNKYNEGVLPYNNLNIYSKTFSEGTVLIYNDPFPLSNPDLTGLWIACDKFISIKAEYIDDSIRLESDTLNIKIKTIESELPFMLSGFSIPGYNTKINDYGYLTATEYYKNPFGLRAFSYYCIYSDCINKKCIHKNTGYRNFFILDNQQIGCIHTPEYDSTLDASLRCPGVMARVVNPFVLPAE